jgi:predicted Rossmann fold flavoprotein
VNNNLRIAVIGGGASGFFAAITAKDTNPNCSVTIFEKSNKLLSKVKISGGGRCNVTHNLFDMALLAKKYPRGEVQLRKLFSQFDTQSTIDWFAKRGVALEALNDGCIFPVANTSQVIIDCFLNEAQKHAIDIKISQQVTAIEKKGSTWELTVKDNVFEFDRIVFAFGGHPKLSSYSVLKNLNLKLVAPVPSLFTFNMPNEAIKSLMGIVVENAVARVEGTKLIGTGPLLITHWGMSGPCILMLSAWGARVLEEKEYKVNCLVNWLGDATETQTKLVLDNYIRIHPNKKILNIYPEGIPSRLWVFLVGKITDNSELIWRDLKGKTYNKLVNTLINDVYKVEGKTTFKEEFVTAGGIALSEIDLKTMQLKNHKGIFAAGEVLDTDGITGGFNFQAAWTTGFVAGKNAAMLSGEL